MSMDDRKSCNSSVPDDVLKPLFAASNLSTLKEALECLIETGKTSDGRSDLASKHILVPVLKLCLYPSGLSGQDLLLSIKLLRNLCAGEVKNQNLLIEQDGVRILSDLISAMGLTSGSDNGILSMVLQVLANVSLAGEQHLLAVWRQFFPLGFLDIARVQSQEICDPLCMLIYTCSEGSNERSGELLEDAGLDIVLEIIRTVTIVGFKEDWVKLHLSRICLEESYFCSTFSKLSPEMEAENSDDNLVSQIHHFGAEQAFLLGILSEIVNERVEDIVVSNDFSLSIFEILRTAVGIVDFSRRGTSSLPTGLPHIDVIGYSLSILRDVSACGGSQKQDEKGDVVDVLASAGLIKFLITLLRDLEPPAIIKMAMNQSEPKEGITAQAPKYCPYRGFRRDIVAIIGNCSYHKKHVQDEIREHDGILLLLQHCVTDEDNPFLREWGIWSMRNVLEGNTENQQLVADLELQKSVDTPEITGLGLRVEVDPETRHPKLFKQHSPSLAREMGEIETTEPIESVQTALSFFGQRNSSPANEEELEKERELQKLMKELEAKDSAYKQALVRLGHHQKTSDDLSTLLRKSDFQKLFYASECLEADYRIDELESAMNEMSHKISESEKAKSNSISKAEEMERALGQEKLETEELLRRISEMNETVVDLKRKTLEIETEKAEAVAELELAAKAAAETQKRLEAMHDMENQLLNKSAHITSLQLELKQANEYLYDMKTELESIKEKENEAQVEIAMLHFKLHNAMPKQVENKNQVEDPMRENEIENMRKELGSANAKIGELITRAEQATSRAEAAEKAKAALEDEMKKSKEHKEMKNATLVVLREESISGNFSSNNGGGSSSSKYDTLAKNYHQPLSKILNMKF